MKGERRKDRGRICLLLGWGLHIFIIFDGAVFFFEGYAHTSFPLLML